MKKKSVETHRNNTGVQDTVNQRESLKEALRESEEKYYILMENAMDGVYIIQDNVIKFVNKRMVDMSGYTVEELTGMSIFNLVPSNFAPKLIEMFSLYERGQSISETFNTQLLCMVSAVEMRDPYTAGHQIRSADIARAIATEMGLAQDKIDGIRMAGSIHDIGKLSIPAEILSKPTKLTDIEFSMIKEHSQFGYEMLKDIDSPWPLAEIVYQHHERINGSGYPRNLKGDEIIIEARIMAVAEVVEAMASHRPYRPSLGIEAALEEIEKNRGVLYDNDVADACLRLFREKGYQLP